MLGYLGSPVLVIGELIKFPLGPCDYISWQHEEGPLPFMKLASKPKVEKLLFGHFLKLALPCARGTFGMASIAAPLNLTAFFRILVHLYELGYPAHWLSEVVSTILSGTITTTARAPRTIPLSLKEAKQNFINRKMCVKPFVAEFCTLVTVWQCVLPFGLLTSIMKESGTWKIFLWRTDTWERVSDGVNVDKIKEGKSWV